MSENSDLRNNSEKSSGAMQKNKIPGSLISVILIITAAFLVFIMVNSRLMAGTRIAREETFVPARSSCCSIGSPVATNETSIASAALDYYRANYGSTDGLQARVEDFGCHQEITISRNNQVVKRFGYSGSSFYDLTP